MLQHLGAIKAAQSQVPSGWGKIVLSLMTDLYEMGWDGDLQQIKSKFGGLRFYIGSTTPELRRRIAEAEQLSLETCEECGAPAAQYAPNGWVRTLCPECHTD